MIPTQDYCKITEGGVSHLFLAFDYGSFCVCGRKTFAFATEDEQPGFRDAPRESAPTAFLLAACAHHTVPGTPQTWRMSLRLAYGDDVIRHARETRDAVSAMRRQRWLVRVNAAVQREGPWRAAL